MANDNSREAFEKWFSQEFKDYIGLGEDVFTQDVAWQYTIPKVGMAYNVWKAIEAHYEDEITKWKRKLCDEEDEHEKKCDEAEALQADNDRLRALLDKCVNHLGHGEAAYDLMHKIKQALANTPSTKEGA